MSHHQACCIFGVCCPMAEQIEAMMTRYAEYMANDSDAAVEASEAASGESYGHGHGRYRKEEKFAEWMLTHQVDWAPKGTNAAIEQLYGEAFKDKYTNPEG